MKSSKYLIFLLILGILALFSANAEECEHAFQYTNNGESGHTAVCSLCNTIRNDAHNLSSSHKEATCVSPAVTTYSCSLCSYVYTFTEGEKASGHAWGDYTVVRKATCRQAGLKSRTCPDCGVVESVEEAQLEHQYGQWSQYDEKWHIRYCKVCDWAYKGSHRLNDGVITVQPTATQLGLIKYTCRVCQDEFENILRLDGTIYAIDPVDVLGNGTTYLLAASREADEASSGEVSFSCGGSIDVRQSGDTQTSVYANSKTGNYAGILIENGTAALDVLPKDDNETLGIEFLKLGKNAASEIRIFNATGALEIGNLDSKRVIIAQHKDENGKIITLLMRFTDKRDSFEGEARMLISDTSVITIENKNGEYAFILPENALESASLTFKYVRSSGKITVNPRNQEKTANGVTVEIVEGTNVLRSAENTKSAETYVKLTSPDGAWRLRATYPNGYALETPLFKSDGTYLSDPVRYLMDLETLSSLSAIDPMPQPEETPSALTLPEAPVQTDAPVQTPAPSLDISEAELITGETVEILSTDRKNFACKGYAAIVITFDNMTFTIDVNGDTGGWTITSVTLTQQGGANGFKILNAYEAPWKFALDSASGTVTIRAQMKNEKGKTQEVTLGTFRLA